MLRKLSHMDRITQLQDEIQQLLVIMTSTIAYLTSRATFVELSSEVPVTKQRDPTKYDTQYVFDGLCLSGSATMCSRIWQQVRKSLRQT
jgi:mediator of RNA polymerase II transcription subunit 21